MNLLGKRTGIGDHFRADRWTHIMFPDAVEYDDIVNNDGDIAKCIKNRYVTDEWLKAWIKCPANKEIGKPNAFYVYNIEYDGIDKPAEKYINEEDIIKQECILYERANGIMYIDFDNIDKNIVEVIEKCFIDVSERIKTFQWFERSWSGEGCHIRINTELKLYHKVEWMFIYMYHLDILLKEINKYIDTSMWTTNNVIDWSCASISRGFAIPYNENGVVENIHFDKNKFVEYNNADELNYIANYFMQTWDENIYNKFLAKINKRQHKQSRISKTYSVKNIHEKYHRMVDGEQFDYNWRLKCVTTLMALYDNDKDKVRTACGYIYNFIKPYKNHTYVEMIGNELENKIFRNADFTLGINHMIINDLEKHFGFEFESHYKTNDIYLSEFHNDTLNL